MRKWTVMVYMAGDNNLDSNGVSDLREMKGVGSSKEVAILAQFDRKGSGRHTKRYYLRNYQTSATLATDEVDDLGETNTGSAKEFTEFIKWGLKDYEAEHYLVIIWGHGAGAYDEDIYYADERTLRRNIKRHGVFRPVINPNAQPLDFGLLEAVPASRLLDTAYLIAPDDGAKDFLDNVELKNALEQVGRKIDILGMDACLMSMVEVCYQVRNSVEITVGSEGEESLDGWPYQQFLSLLVQNPEMKPRKLAATIVEEFVALYSEYDDATANLSACDLTKCDVLATNLANLANSLLAHLNKPQVLDAIMLSRYRVQADEVIESVDLYDYCELLRHTCKQKDIRSSCDAIIALFKTRLIIKSEFLGDAVKYSHGLGIYFPRDVVSSLYHRLDLVQKDVTRWVEFIGQYVELTSR